MAQSLSPPKAKECHACNYSIPNTSAFAGSDEDTCSGNAPSVGGVYCLNDRGTISCRNRGDCPRDDRFTDEETGGETDVTYSCKDHGEGKECVETGVSGKCGDSKI